MTASDARAAAPAENGDPARTGSKPSNAANGDGGARPNQDEGVRPNPFLAEVMSEEDGNMRTGLTPDFDMYKQNDMNSLSMEQSPQSTSALLAMVSQPAVSNMSNPISTAIASEGLAAFSSTPYTAPFSTQAGAGPASLAPTKAPVTDPESVSGHTFRPNIANAPAADTLNMTFGRSVNNSGGQPSGSSGVESIGMVSQSSDPTPASAQAPASNTGVRSSPMDSKSMSDDRSARNAGPHNPRGVGEIGAASGLYMLSQGHNDSEQGEQSRDTDKNHDDRSSDAGTGAKRRRGARGATQPKTEDAEEDQAEDASGSGTNSGRSTSRGSRSSNKPESNAENDDTPEDSEVAKRKNFLERNRQAALKCRQRKKAWLASLQAKVEYLQSDNESLQGTVEALRSEVMFLKSQLLQQQNRSQLEQENKDGSDDVARSISNSFGPLNVTVGGGFVGYNPTSAASNPLLASMDHVSHASSQQSPPTSQAQSSMENTMGGIPAFNGQAMPRMTQVPTLSQPMMQQYAPKQSYPGGRSSG